jgi:Domain of unknown function (DUF4340)
MSRTPTLILIVLALVLAIVTFIVVRSSGGAGEALPLLGATTEPVQQFTVWKDGHIVSQAERQMISNVPGWMQTAPIKHPLLTTAVEGLLREALSLSTAERANGDATSLGFKPAQALFEVGDLGVIELGRRTVAGRALVRKRGGDHAYVVDDTLHRLLLDTDSVAWRKRDVFDNLGVEVGRVRLERGDETIQLARLRGAWRVIEPVGEIANEAAVHQLLAYLVDSDVQSFILDEPEDLARFGLAEPSLTVTVETDRKHFGSNGEVDVETDTQALHLGGPADIAGSVFYARRAERDCITTVAAPLVARLHTPLADLLSRVGTAVQPTDVAALEIVGADSTVSLKRTLEGWTVQPARVGIAAGPLAEELLTVLCVTEALEVTLPDQAADRPPATSALTLRGYDTSDLARFEAHLEGGTLHLRNVTNGVSRAYPASDLLASFLK